MGSAGGAGGMRNDVLIRALAFASAVPGAAVLLFVFLDLLPGASPPGTALGARLLALLGSADHWQRLSVTLPLLLVALAVAVLGGLGLRRLPAAAGIATALALLPPFWLGMLLSLLVAGLLRLLPPSGFLPWSDPLAALSTLLLPALALGLPHAGHVALALRERGRVALPAIVGRTLPALLVATVLVETVFYLPGLGRLVLGAAQQQDLATLRAGLFVLVLVGATGLLLSTVIRLPPVREPQQ